MSAQMGQLQLEFFDQKITGPKFGGLSRDFGLALAQKPSQISCV